MGRPEGPLERDGSPVREFAFWLRDLRHRSDLTYQQIARVTNYSTSTLQAAAAGHHLPTLKVAEAFVVACGGDAGVWRAYWSHVKRALDGDSPHDVPRRVTPPWAAEAALSLGDESRGLRAVVDAAVAASSVEAGAAPVAAGPGALDAPDGWYVESFTAHLRLDTPQPQAVERRVVVAAVDGLSELATSISVPRHEDDSAPGHQLHAELLTGGELQLREQPYESYFRHVIALPRPLAAGERHEYELLLRLPDGQPMAPHYVYVPFCRSDHFELRATFSPDHLPEMVQILPGTPPAVIYERSQEGTAAVPDASGTVTVSFRRLRVGHGYGVRWKF